MEPSDIYSVCYIQIDRKIQFQANKRGGTPIELPETMMKNFTGRFFRTNPNYFCYMYMYRVVTFSPERLEKRSIVSIAVKKDFDETSKIKQVSSAYW